MFFIETKYPIENDLQQKICKSFSFVLIVPDYYRKPNNHRINI